MGCEYGLSHHPDEAALRGFALGQLRARELNRIAAHLAHCPACVRVVEAVPDDDLVALLRRRPPNQAVPRRDLTRSR